MQRDKFLYDMGMYQYFNYQISFQVPAKYKDFFENALWSEDNCVRSYEFVPTGEIWQIDLLQENEPKAADFQHLLDKLCFIADCAIPDFTISKIENIDWLAKVAHDFPPLEIGQFIVHGTHYKADIIAHIPIIIDAGLAFGTGEHETTSMCLEMLQKLPKPSRFLDLGCGSAILAIAAAKLWSDITLEASDNDETAVLVARENCVQNHCPQINCLVSEGFAELDGSYDMIAANILANPLIAMAGDFAKHTAMGGKIILSGLLETQENDVISAFVKQGFILIDKLNKNGWSCLLMQK